MSRTLVAILAMLSLAESVFATPVIIKMKNGVEFNHWVHMAKVVMISEGGTCHKCHASGPGRIPGFGRDWAHENCRGCHGELNRGPYNCSGCHLKVYD
jgi:hypothetical protein